MINKGSLILVSCLLALSGCQTKEKKPQASHLSLLACSDLEKFHQSTQQELVEATQSREKHNAVNVAVGVIGMLSGGGGFTVNGSSKLERELTIEIAAIESVAKEKGCELSPADAIATASNETASPQ